MAQDYKGYQVPEYLEMADAVIAFEAFVDSMPPLLPPLAGAAGRLLTNDGTDQMWGPKLTVSQAAPSGGVDGDVWFVVP